MDVDGDQRTGTFNQMRVKAVDTTCSVNGVLLEPTRSDLWSG